jgi:Fe2+ or Zn2+ uptake regulation protein
MKDARSTTHTQYTPEEYAKVLRSRGLKATPQRLALLTVLAESNRPLALHDIETAEETKHVNQSTLYRAVKDCTEAGIIRPVNLRHTHAHYEMVSEDEHHHLICTVCGTVENFVSTVCSTIERDALKVSTLFTEVSDHSFEFYGICTHCAR